MNLHQFLSEYSPYLAGGFLVTVWIFIFNNIRTFWAILKKVFLVEYLLDGGVIQSYLYKEISKSKKVDFNVFKYTIASNLVESDDSTEKVPKVEWAYRFFKRRGSGLFIYNRCPIWYMEETKDSMVNGVTISRGQLPTIIVFRFWDPIKPFLTKILNNTEANVYMSPDSAADPVVELTKPLYKTPKSAYEVSKSTEAVIEEMTNFARSQDWYSIRGLRHKRGYLLYGPPGTGKTTLADYLNRTTWFGGITTVSIPELSADKYRELIRNFENEAMGKTFTRILVFNDLHLVFDGSTPLFKKDDGVTFDLFINSLSDLKCGLILITTNDVSKIDPALGAPIPGDPHGRSTRPGRIDRCVEIAYPDWDTRFRIAKVICRDEVAAKSYATQTEGYSQAQIVEHVSRTEIDNHYMDLNNSLKAS